MTKPSYEEAELKKLAETVLDKYRLEEVYSRPDQIDAAETRFYAAATPRAILDLLAELARVRGLLQRQWISVEERLPEVGGTYLVTYQCALLNESAVGFGYFIIFEDGGKWSRSGVWPDIRAAVTHWMEIPKRANFPQSSSLVPQGAESKSSLSSPPPISAREFRQKHYVLPSSLDTYLKAEDFAEAYANFRQSPSPMNRGAESVHSGKQNTADKSGLLPTQLPKEK